MDGNFIGRERKSVMKWRVSRWWIGGSIEERFEERFRILVWEEVWKEGVGRIGKFGNVREFLWGRFEWKDPMELMHGLDSYLARDTREKVKKIETIVWRKRSSCEKSGVNFGFRSIFWWSQERESSKRNSVCIDSRSNGCSMKMFDRVCAISKTVSINAPSNRRSRFDRNHAGS